MLAAVSCLLAVPGVPAALIAFADRDGSVVTRAAAAFGLGYAVAAGCAFALAAARVFTLATYLPTWLAVSAILWIWALRRHSLRAAILLIGNDARKNKIVLAVGAVVVVGLVMVHLRYLQVLNGPRYIYYLNGVEIANSHGVPRQTLEYGQAWPPATDKVYLDAFTAVLVLLNPNVAIGPSVLLLTSVVGAAAGLWATAWELGLRRVGVLLPLLFIGNVVILSTAVSIAYTDYRAEDFGRAVAFCALAVGIAAIRERGWRLAVAAGVILAAASGTHLIPVVVTALALCLAGVAEVLFRARNRRWFLPLARGAALAGVAAAGGVAIRLFAGGSFGLQGAQGASSYASLNMAYDPTAYLYGGLLYPSDVPSNVYWYAKPGQVIETMVTGAVHLPAWQLWLWLVTPMIAAVILVVSDSLRPVGLVGLGTMMGIVAIGVYMAVSYHYYIEQTFGIRRLATYVTLAFLLLILGVAEATFGVLERHVPHVATAGAVVAVLAMAAWLVPSTAVTRQAWLYGQERTRLVDWVRAETPCNARFLINQRTEGVFTTLTGRYALLEGMGAFLRTDRLPYVDNLLLSAKMFFRAPQKHEDFLLRHDISFVIVARGFQELGYQAPLGPPNIGEMNSVPFLRRVYMSKTMLVYEVTAVGTAVAPESPLLHGPYLHCLTSPVHI